MYDVHGIVLVLLLQVIQDVELLSCLLVEVLLVPHHLQGHMLVEFVVVRVTTCPKLPFPMTLSTSYL